MAEYFVAPSPTGNDSNPGTQNQPWLTLAHAAATIAGGDTVWVMDGTYSISSSVYISTSGSDDSHRTVFASLNKWGAKLDNLISATGGENDFVFRVYADFVDISGFDISGAGGGGGIFSAGTATGSGSPLGSYNRILNNYIHDMGSSVTHGQNVTGIDFARYGSGVYNAIYNTADSNIIRNVGSLNESGCHGIYFGTAYGTCTNNIVSGTPGYGLNFFHFPHHMKIKNNLVFNCGDNSSDPEGGQGGGIYLSAGGSGYTNGTDEPCDYCEVDNNIVVGSIGTQGAGIIEDSQHASPPELVVGHNLFRNNCFFNNQGSYGDILIQASTSSVSGSLFAPQTPTTEAADTFKRGNQAGWGPASGGGTWSNFGDTSHIVLSIVSNQGKATGSSTDNFMVLDPGYSGDAEALVRVKTSSNASGNFQGVLLRYTDTTHWYACYLKNGNTLKIDSAASSLASASFTWSTNTEYWIRFNITGTTLSGKAWDASGSEPGSWTLTTSDNTLSSGKTGIYVSPDSSGTTAFYDSFSAVQLNTDPKFPFFVNYQTDGSGNYHMQAKSPCVDGGIATNAPTTDLDGYPRPFGAAYDVGPYEYHITAGQITGATGTNTLRLGTQTLADAEAQVRFQISQSGDIVGLTLRDNGLNNFVRLRQNATELQLVHQTPAGGFVVLATTSFNPKVSTFYRLKLRAVGSNLYGKLWLDSATEPAGWLVTATTTVTGAGQVGISTSLGQTADIALFDSYSVLEASFSPPPGQVSTQDLALRAVLADKAGPPTKDLGMRARIVDLSRVTVTTYAAKRPPLERKFPKS